MSESNQLVTNNAGAVKAASTRSLRAERTRERLLRTAIRLFARHGFDGLSVDALVARARVNKRMVYHYFGSKAGLYAACLEAAYGELALLESELVSEGDEPFQAVERIVRGYFAFLQQNRDFSALLLWENLQGGRALPQIRTRIFKAGMLAALQRIIDDGVRRGQFRPNLNARHLLIDLIGLAQVYVSNRLTLTASVGVDLSDRLVLAAAVDHAVELVLQGVAAGDLSAGQRTGRNNGSE